MGCFLTWCEAAPPRFTSTSHAKLTTTARYARVATGMIAAVTSPLDDLTPRKRKKGKTGPS